MFISHSRAPSSRTIGIGLALLAITAIAQAGPGAQSELALRRHYAARGEIHQSLPREAVAIQHQGRPYYYRGGEWYAPRGSRFVVIAPPLGAIVPFLPGAYATFWFGGAPYYYANDVYYSWRPELQGYEVTRPPASAAAQAPPQTAAPVTDPFVYPKNGQSDQQQADDRYECHRWAATQSSFDPTAPLPDSLAADATAARAAYLRALTACLEGRGYSVR